MLDYSVLEQDIIKIGAQYIKNALMADYTTFKIGGPCDFLVIPKTINEILATINLANIKKAPLFFLGNGSDLLVSDNGIRGIVILLSNNFSEICRINDESFFIQSGASIAKLSKFCLDNSLTGAEFAWGIPGSIGGAIYMNAGAYGGEMKDIVSSVEFIDEGLNLSTINSSQLDFSYRHSFFSDKKCCILGAVISLKKGDKTAIKTMMDDYLMRRKTKQPLEFASGGSTFKRPIGNFASLLIEQVGLKGFAIGGAQVSEKHSGFIINTGNATYDDVKTLIKYVQQQVKEKTGYSLECEIECVEG